MVNFIFVIIELFVYFLQLRRYQQKFVEVAIFWRGWVTFGEFLTGKEALTTNDYWCQKTRVIAILCGANISAVHHLVLSQYAICSSLKLWQTVGQNCDSNTMHCITCRMVKIHCTIVRLHCCTCTKSSVCDYEHRCWLSFILVVRRHTNRSCMRLCCIPASNIINTDMCLCSSSCVNVNCAASVDMLASRLLTPGLLIIITCIPYMTSQWDELC